MTFSELLKKTCEKPLCSPYKLYKKPASAHSHTNTNLKKSYLLCRYVTEHCKH